MAGSFHKIMAYLGLVDDYDDYEDLAPERGRPPAPQRSRPPARARREEPRDYYEDERYDDGRYEPPARSQAPMGTVSRIRPMTRSGEPADPVNGPAPRPRVVPMAPSTSRPEKVTPHQFADAKEVGDHIRNQRPVIVNLQQADLELQRRMIDFCSGVAYALHGGMERVADGVFLLTPSNVTVSAEERARLERRGYHLDD
jgi:cell division inhibitor SepF